MSKHNLQIKEYPATEDYPSTTVVACLDHDKQEVYHRRRTADLEAIIENNEVYICCNDAGCEGERGCESNLLNAIGIAYDAGAASVDRRAIDKWQSMESAPKTGEHIQVINVNGYGFGFCGGKRQHASDVVHWFVDGFYSSVFGTDQETPMTFTHWRPLPDMDAVLAEMEANNGEPH